MLWNEEEEMSKCVYLRVCVCTWVRALLCLCTCLRVCMYGTDGKTSQGLLCNWKRREVVIAF